MVHPETEITTDDYVALTKLNLELLWKVLANYVRKASKRIDQGLRKLHLWSLSDTGQFQLVRPLDKSKDEL